MPNCTHSEVRYIIDTGLTDVQLTALIVWADAEMTARCLTTAEWTVGLKAQVSALLTASLASMNDVRSTAKADYQGATDLPKYYRLRAEELINRASLPAMISYNEPVEGEDDE